MPYRRRTGKGGRLFAPREEEALSATLGADRDADVDMVKLPRVLAFVPGPGRP